MHGNTDAMFGCFILGLFLIMGAVPIYVETSKKWVARSMWAFGAFCVAPGLIHILTEAWLG